jgi:SAM-dependent MidA family methyltransferase
MEAALYGEGGFFASAHGAGRAGRDFVTSPETGSLFGACAARALDWLWEVLQRPDPFLVVEAGAGNGRLARDVLRAEPACAPALHYVLVERSAALRAEQRTRLALEPADEALGPYVRAAGVDTAVPQPGTGPIVAALDELPALAARDAVLLANELLDNLPFGIAQRTTDGWHEVRVALAPDGGFEEMLVPSDSDPGIDAPIGTRVPLPRGVQDWARACEQTIERGFVLAIDYMCAASELADRPWLRTYRAHEHGADPLVEPGAYDITGDVVIEQLTAALPFDLLRLDRQADWLAALGIDELVAEGRAAWDEGAARGDLAALAGRSRISEERALVDPAGLGAHRVALFARNAGGNDFEWRR